MSKGPDVSIPLEVIEQLRTVQNDGRANMVDIRSVQVVANDLGLRTLVVWVQDVQGLPRSQMASTWVDALEKIIT